VAGAELLTWPANLDRHSQRERDGQRASATPCYPPHQHWPPQRQDPPMPPTPSPTYERLRETIAKRMRMKPRLPTPDAPGAPGTRIFQATTSPAPAQDVARRILGEDVTQIDYTTERVKRMVGKVHLQRHHPLRARHLRPGGRRSRRLLRSSRAERRRARPVAGAVPPAP
jgi:hypothetical protein